MLRAFLALLLLTFVPQAPAADPAPAAPAAPSDPHDDSWIQQYYRDPHPERFEVEVQKMETSGALHSNDALPSLAEFFACLFRSAQPEQFAQWIKTIGALPEADRRPFLIAMHWANTNASQAALVAIATGKGDAAGYAKKLLEMPIPSLETLADPKVAEIDMCWAAFMATGDPTYALIVIHCAVRPTKGDVQVDTSQEAARWSLKALCETHPKLRQIKDDFYRTASPAERRALEEIFQR